ncbi:MAG: type II toxin-antitoxin system VapC family toxin [Patescibacteria group bacterium]
MNRLEDLLRNKHLLLDTCVLINFHKYQESPELKEFFKAISDSNCALITIDQVYCEFLKYADDRQEYLDLFEWLGNLVPDVLYPTKEDLYATNQIYLALKVKKKNSAEHPSLEDLLLGSMLMKWPDKVYLATVNHKDFPTWFYDRVYLHAFDDRAGNVSAVGIYQFNVDKYVELIKDFG